MATRATPRATVVIATARRETRLAFALDALRAQTLPPDEFEVIVVRSEDPGEKTAAPAGLNARFLSAAADSGPAAKRNIGWRAANAPLVVFTDDDCRPEPVWLERMLAAAGEESEAGNGYLLQGRTEPDPDERPLLHGLAVSVQVLEPSAWYATCNIAYPRELLERLDGFDEAFGGRDTGDYPVGGEDTDLGLRAVAKGARPRYVPEALVRHAVHTRHLPRALRDTRRWRSVPAVLARHPEQRGALHYGMFGRRSHALLLVALVAVPLRRRPLMAAALTLPYLADHLGTYPRTPRGVARALIDAPARALVDAVAVGVTAVGAARYRTPVL